MENRWIVIKPVFDGGRFAYFAACAPDEDNFPENISKVLTQEEIKTLGHVFTAMANTVFKKKQRV